METLKDECFKTELDLFSIPPIQTSIEDGTWDIIRPHPNYNTGTVEFEIPSNSIQYLNLSETEFHATVSIRKSDRTTIIKPNDTDNIGPVNNLLSSLFQQIEVLFNSITVENTNSTYCYRAYLENLLNYSKESKDTFLESCLFTKDDPDNRRGGFKEFKDEFVYIDDGTTKETVTGTDGKTSDKKETITANSAVAKRITRFNTDGKCQMVGRLHLDVFSMNRYLLSNIAINLKMTRSKNQFCLITQKYNDEIFYIDDCFLKIRRVRISPSVLLAHNMALEKTTAKYPLKRVLIKAVTLPLSHFTTITNLHKGVVPTRLVLGLVLTSAYSGNSNILNPFDFQHFNLSELSIQISSQLLPYTHSLKFDYEKNQYLVGYNTLFKNIRMAPNGISYSDYSKGNCLYAFDFTPDLCSGDHLSLLRDGDLNIGLNFNKALTKSVTAVVYLEFDHILEINKSRQIMMDYKL